MLHKVSSLCWIMAAPKPWLCNGCGKLCTDAGDRDSYALHAIVPY